MTATRQIPERRWQRSGRFNFRSKAQGYGMANKHWICQPCNRWFDKDTVATVKNKKACPNCGGVVLKFDSKKEADRFQVLRILAGEGKISDLKHHPRTDLITINPGGQRVKVTYYEADSSYIENGELVYEDVKPKDKVAQDPVFKLKRRHFEAQTGIEIKIVN